MKHQIFLSYSRDDTALMERLRGDLQSAGFSVWTDAHIQPGSPSWKAEIERAIRATECLVVLLSPDAAQSKWVREEIDFAGTLNKPIFPLLAEGDETNAVPFGMSTAQWIDLRDAGAYDSAFERLASALAQQFSQTAGSVAASAPVLPAIGPSSRRRLPLPLVGGAVLALLLLVGLLATQPSGTGASTATASESPSPSTLSTPAAPGDLPAGWTRYEGGNASIAAPASWTGTSEDTLLIELGGQMAGDEARWQAFQEAIPTETYKIFQGNLTTFRLFVVNEQAFPFQITFELARLRVAPLWESINMQVVEESRVQLPAGEVMRLHLRSRSETISGEGVTYYLPVGRTLFYVTFLLASREDFERALPEINAIMETFRVSASN